MAHDPIRFGHLIDLDMAAAQAGAPWIQGFGKLNEGLFFTAATVTVFSKER
jgi:hypothetical protein